MSTATRSPRSRWPRRSPAQAGRDGERLAALLYLLRGYRVIGRDVRTPYGQLDVVCRRGRLLVVVEVKRRRTRGRYGAAHALSRVQAERLDRATAHLQRRCRWASGSRIDLVAIDGWRVRVHASAVTSAQVRRRSGWNA